jgi:probable rRNA maturation factor
MNTKASNKIYFHFPLQLIHLKKRAYLKSFVESIFKSKKKKIQEINFIFCGNQQLLSLNRKYLKHKYYTDVLTFCFSEEKDPIFADIFISQEQVLKNAKSFNTSVNKEIHRVIFHGVLHLCGYNDKTIKEKQSIRFWEDYYLTKYFE